MASGVDMKLLKQTKFPPEFNTKVDMKKVNIEVMKKWIAGKISDVLGSEDDVVIELCFNLLEGDRFPDIKKLQIQLTGFLEKDTPKFCKELWKLCLSAQENPQGVPHELLEAKKAELLKEKAAAENAAKESQRRKEEERLQESNIGSIRQRERGERDRGRGRGGRGGYEYGGRPSRRSRTPPRRRSPFRDSYRAPPLRREIDTYVPGGRDRRRSPLSRRSSRSQGTRSLSRSPAPRRQMRNDSPRDRRRNRSRSTTPSASPSPKSRERGGNYGRGRRYGGARRKASYTPSYSSPSRSRSPRRFRRRSPSFSSRSRSPPRKYKQYRRRNTSSPESMSRSGSLSRDRRRSYKSRRQPSSSADDRYPDTRTNGRKGHKYHSGRRRSPFPSPSPPPRRRKSPNRSQSPKSSPTYRARSGRSSSPRQRKEVLGRVADRQPGRLSRSPTPERYRERKRHRSIQRYAPGPRRGHKHSSVSPESNKKRKVADDEEHDRSRTINTTESKARPQDAEMSEEAVLSGQSTTKLREKLLKEKVLAMRRTNSTPKDARAD